MNIIIKDRRDEKTRVREEQAKQIKIGYYHQECAGNLRKKSGSETTQIKRAWETFRDSGL